MIYIPIFVFCLENDAPWSCNERSCGFKTSGNAVRKILDIVQQEIDQLDELEPGPAAIEQREALLKKVFERMIKSSKNIKKLPLKLRAFYMIYSLFFKSPVIFFKPKRNHWWNQEILADVECCFHRRDDHSISLKK